ncbi:hypothetical protein PoB_002380800 [Plakobranchus ocellatus]|uniref:Uncharacterized protein n=1 Tax=Plakobranchus ocellatus TaxID=259542 RepID=A0AAV3ZRZ9_9GAST|nr:hypothetical protein PoB_002380800 [Plakobranchus ocellatus]
MCGIGKNRSDLTAVTSRGENKMKFIVVSVFVSAKIKGQSSNQVMSSGYMSSYSQITPTGQGYYPGSAGSLSYGATGTVPGYENGFYGYGTAGAEYYPTYPYLPSTASMTPATTVPSTQTYQLLDTPSTTSSGGQNAVTGGSSQTRDRECGTDCGEYLIEARGGCRGKESCFKICVFM